MKRLIRFLLLTIILELIFISCRNKQDQNHLPLTNSQMEDGVFNYSKEVPDSNTGVGYSTEIQLTVKKDNIKGKMIWSPFEKDGRFGVLRGSRNKKGELHLIYDYYQEGERSLDSMVVRLKGDKLIIKDVWFINLKTREKIEESFFRDTLELRNYNVISEDQQERFKVFEK